MEQGAFKDSLASFVVEVILTSVKASRLGSHYIDIVDQWRCLFDLSHLESRFFFGGNKTHRLVSQISHSLQVLSNRTDMANRNFFQRLTIADSYRRGLKALAVSI